MDEDRGPEWQGEGVKKGTELPMAGVNGVEEEAQPDRDEALSKRQLRKMRRQQKWLLYKAEKRQKEKDKKKKRYADARERGECLGPTRKMLKRNCMSRSVCGIRVVIDCSFDDLMTDRDVVKLLKQIQHSYSVNRRAAHPLQYFVCGISGKMQVRMEDIGDFKNWDVYFKKENYLELFDKDDVVYLTSESSGVLADLEPSKAYIIGGLVDHNHHKGLCYQLAEKNGIAHAQLPISKYLDMKTRRVLAINHVFEILLRYTETKDWENSLSRVIPERKGATTKNTVIEKDHNKETETSNMLSALSVDDELLVSQGDEDKTFAGLPKKTESIVR